MVSRPQCIIDLTIFAINLWEIPRELTCCRLSVSLLLSRCLHFYMRIFLECGIALMLSLILCLGSRSGFCHPCSILSRLPHRSFGWSAATSSPDRSTDWACMNLYHLTETAVGFGGSILPIWSSAGKKDSHSFDNRPISESSLWTKGNPLHLFLLHYSTSDRNRIWDREFMDLSIITNQNCGEAQDSILSNFQSSVYASMTA